MTEKYDAMMRETAKYDAMMREHVAKYAPRFAFLDALRTVDRVTPLMEKFGISLGEAQSTHLHWLVLAHDGGTPEERAAGVGGM